LGEEGEEEEGKNNFYILNIKTVLTAQCLWILISLKEEETKFSVLIKLI
jgi:hypothetical protein